MHSRIFRSRPRIPCAREEAEAAYRALGFKLPSTEPRCRTAHGVLVYRREGRVLAWTLESGELRGKDAAAFRRYRKALKVPRP